GPCGKKKLRGHIETPDFRIEAQRRDRKLLAGFQVDDARSRGEQVFVVRAGQVDAGIDAVVPERGVLGCNQRYLAALRVEAVDAQGRTERNGLVIEPARREDDAQIVATKIVAAKKVAVCDAGLAGGQVTHRKLVAGLVVLAAA